MGNILKRQDGGGSADQLADGQMVVIGIRVQALSYIALSGPGISIKRDGLGGGASVVGFTEKEITKWA